MENFKDTMPRVHKSKPVSFETAMKRMLKWMKANRIDGVNHAQIQIKTLVGGGYIHLLGEDCKTFDFTKWGKVYPPMASPKALVRRARKFKKEYEARMGNQNDFRTWKEPKNPLTGEPLSGHDLYIWREEHETHLMIQSSLKSVK